jgi:hypothetical protein
MTMADLYGPPMTVQQLRDRIRPRAALSQETKSLQHRSPSPSPAPRPHGARSDGLTEFEVVVELGGVRIGERAYGTPALRLH